MAFRHLRKAAPQPVGLPPGEDTRAFDALAADLSHLRDSHNASALAAQEGRLVTGQAFGAGATVKVAHGLARTPSGWLVTRALTSAPLLFEVSRDRYFLTLTHTGASDTRVDFWVF